MPSFFSKAVECFRGPKVEYDKGPPKKTKKVAKTMYQPPDSIPSKDEPVSSGTTTSPTTSHPQEIIAERPKLKEPEQNGSVPAAIPQHIRAQFGAQAETHPDEIQSASARPQRSQYANVMNALEDRRKLFERLRKPPELDVRLGVASPPEAASTQRTSSQAVETEASTIFSTEADAETPIYRQMSRRGRRRREAFGIL